MFEHPIISRLNRTGYTAKEIIVRDKYGDEILSGDTIIEYEGEMVLHENLNRLLESLGFSFKLAE